MQLMRVDQTKIFKAVHEVIAVVKDTQPVMGMKLFLQGCQAINRIQDCSALEEIAYEFASEALLVY